MREPVLPAPVPTGASQAAIRAHYDVSNEFFEAWLDSSMTYSCAMLESGEESLAAAQARKLDYHIEQAGLVRKERALDIGCGWGSALERMTSAHGVRKAVGLTLSDAQAEWIRRQNWPGVEVFVQDWAGHDPPEPYAGITCIGAFEHFARPESTRPERVEAYRAFFSRCRELVVVEGRMSLQTIAFGIGKYIPDTPLADIFPESHLPRLSEIAEAFDRIFELELIRNDRHHYVRTLGAWLQNLEANWDAAVRATSADVAERYRRYLQFTLMGFSAGFFDLLRISVR